MQSKRKMRGSALRTAERAVCEVGLVFAMALAWGPLTAQAQNVGGEVADPPAPPPAAAPADEPGQPGASVTLAPVRPDGVVRINLAVSEEYVGNVIRLIAHVANVSVVAGTTNMHRKVTATILDQPWDVALRVIVAKCDLRLTEQPAGSGLFVVEPVVDAAAEPWITETFQLNYLNSRDAAELLQSLLGGDAQGDAQDAGARAAAHGTPSAAAPAQPGVPEKVREDVTAALRENGRVVSFPDANTVVVSTTANRMAEVRKVLAAVDKPRAQVYIEAKIIEVSGVADKAVGVDWSMLRSFDVGAGGEATFDGEGRTRMTPFVRGRSRSEIRERGSASYGGRESGEAWDGRGNRLHSSPGALNPTDAAAMPIDGIGSDADGGTKDPFASSFTATPGAIAVEGWNRSDGLWRAITDRHTAVFTADALHVVLSALEKLDDTSVISNPKIIVANEEKAVIDMSRKEPYVAVSRRTEGTGDAVTHTYTTEMKVVPGNNELLPYIEQAFFSYGIKVEVTPRVNNATNITLTIQPTISARTEYWMPGDGLTRYPLISSKSVRTVFTLSDGMTAVIGGLTHTSDEQSVKKIPLLGDIPLLGKYLFSHTTTQTRQTETIIFVTVRLVAPDDATAASSVPQGSALTQLHVTPEGQLVMAEQAALARAERERSLERVEVMEPLGDYE